MDEKLYKSEANKLDNQTNEQYLINDKDGRTDPKCRKTSRTWIITKFYWDLKQKNEIKPNRYLPFCIKFDISYTY